MRNDHIGLDVPVDLDDLLSDPRVLAAAEDADARDALIDHLIALRKKAKLRQQDIAERMSTTQSSVSEFERGGVDPHFSTLQRYARAVGHCVTVQVISEDQQKSSPYSETAVKSSGVEPIGKGFLENYVAHESKRSDFVMAA